MRNITHTLFIVFLIALPQSVHAAVSATDTVAGLATEITVEGEQRNADITLTLSSPIQETTTVTLHTGSEGNARTWIAGNSLQVAGDYSIALNGQEISLLTVYPDSVDTLKSYINIPSKEIAVGEEHTVTVVLMDRFGNALAGRSTELLSSREDDTVQAITRETDVYGEQQFIVRANTSGTFSLRAIDLIGGKALQSAVQLAAGPIYGAVGGPQQFYRGNPYTASVVSPSAYRAQVGEAPRFDHMDIAIVGQEGQQVPAVKQYEANSMVLTAVDQFGNRFYNFTGTVYMATTDPEATLPAFGIYDFQFADEGQKVLTLGLKFATAGTQTMVLTDTADSVPTDLSQALGSLSVSVEQRQISKPAAQEIVISSPAAGETLGTAEVLVEGTGPAFINIVITGGVQEVTGETDRQGNFSVSVPLDTSATEHTLTVSDADASKNTASVAFSIDITAPELRSIAVMPERPTEGEDLVFVVEAGTDSTKVTIEIDGQSYDMQSRDASSGKYQLLITAPAAGTYDATVSAVDAQGNTTVDTYPFTVAMQGLPRVENVIAEGQINAVALRWDPVDDPDVTAYRIYVGTEPDVFEYTLDTDRPVGAATVAGLEPGSEYFFSVTAIDHERESDVKSDTVSATVLGVQLEVTPDDGSLMMKWASLQNNTPLSKFLLEYSTSAEALEDTLRTNEVERRTLNGELRAYNLRDLINGVTYYLKLTPIATTGEPVTELSATGQGTPTGAGYTAGASDPVPQNLQGSAPPAPRPMNEVPLSQQGVPMWLFWSIVTTSAIVFRVYLKRRRQYAHVITASGMGETIYHL